ncbi:hypothetical protein ACNKHU_14315 [Shigella flexneri]
MTHKKMGVESLLCQAGVTIIKSQTGAGRRLPQFRFFDGFNYVGGSVSTDDQNVASDLRGYAQTFPAWHTPQQK